MFAAAAHDHDLGQLTKELELVIVWVPTACSSALWLPASTAIRAIGDVRFAKFAMWVIGVAPTVSKAAAPRIGDTPPPPCNWQPMAPRPGSSCRASPQRKSPRVEVMAVAMITSATAHGRAPAGVLAVSASYTRSSKQEVDMDGLLLMTMSSCPTWV
ncbi:hypothetical protein [Dactylosporangium sp. NPDC006015]|uniref:hypothetical protein n=1 Tax=Dactylosporangium sp. NPDC006015 TaxID=3154576 RepID=UPI0033B2A8E9